MEQQFKLNSKFIPEFLLEMGSIWEFVRAKYRKYIYVNK